MDLDPPGIHQQSPLRTQIDAAKAAIVRVNVTKTANDEALIEAGRHISQLRDQTPTGWGAFCTKELGISKQWANQLIRFFKGKETPAEHREKKAEAAAERAKVSEAEASVHHVKQEEEARVTRIRQLVYEWRAETRSADDVLMDIEELVK